MNYKCGKYLYNQLWNMTEFLSRIIAKLTGRQAVSVWLREWIPSDRLRGFVELQGNTKLLKLFIHAYVNVSVCV
jgi:hypothetical protein